MIYLIIFILILFVCGSLWLARKIKNKNEQNEFIEDRNNHEGERL